MKYTGLMAKPLKTSGKPALKSPARKTGSSQDRLKQGIRRTSTDSYGGMSMVKPASAP